MWTLWVILPLANAFSGWQINAIRSAMAEYNPPPIAVISAVLWDEVAFTDRINNFVYIDNTRLSCCRNTFANVVHHEIMHTKGQSHNNVSGDIMSYRVTADLNGNIIEDLYIWP